MNGDCPVGARNERDIHNLARTCDELRRGLQELAKSLQGMQVDGAVRNTKTQLLLIGLPGVGSIIGGVVTALIMRGLGG